MTRWLSPLGILGVLLCAGCPMPPDAPDGQGPLAVDPPRAEPEPEPEPEPAESGGTSAAELETRQRGLRVMASEQRDAIGRLVEQTRFSRTSTGMTERVRTALTSCSLELDAIDREIASIARNGSLAPDERHARQSEVKARLRKLAAKLGRMESALRGG